MSTDLFCFWQQNTKGKWALDLFFLFTAYPFWYLGEDEVLVLQMIGFVERLPAEWESRWTSMQMRSRHDLEVEGKQIDPL